MAVLNADILGTHVVACPKLFDTISEYPTILTHICACSLHLCILALFLPVANVTYNSYNYYGKLITLPLLNKDYTRALATTFRCTFFDTRNR